MPFTEPLNKFLKSKVQFQKAFLFNLTHSILSMLKILEMCCGRKFAKKKFNFVTNCRKHKLNVIIASYAKINFNKFGINGNL